MRGEREVLWRALVAAAKHSSLTSGQQRRFLGNVGELGFLGRHHHDLARLSASEVWRMIRNPNRSLLEPSRLKEVPELQLLLDGAAQELRRRDGGPLTEVWVAKYATLSRVEKSRARNIVAREWLGPDGHSARYETRLWNWVVTSLATRFKAISGRWPSYTMKAKDGGRDVRLLQAAAKWIWFPNRPAGGTAGIVKRIKECRGVGRKEIRGISRSSQRTRVGGRIRVKVASALLRNVERGGLSESDRRAVDSAFRALRHIVRGTE